jgi:hypothetical protein
MATGIHEIIEGVVGALYNEKTNLQNIIRTAIYTPLDEKTGVPHGITVIQSFIIEYDDELGKKYYDEKGVEHAVHALGLSFVHDKYEGLVPEDAVHAIRDEVYEYFSSLEAYDRVKLIQKKFHEARNSPRGFMPDNDQNQIGRKKK